MWDDLSQKPKFYYMLQLTLNDVVAERLSVRLLRQHAVPGSHPTSSVRKHCTVLYCMYCTVQYCTVYICILYLPRKNN